MIEDEQRAAQPGADTADSLRILSFGGGVQSTALAILVAQGKLQADRIVFADTEAELPETYAHITRLDAWLRERGWYVRVVSAGNLYQYIAQRSTVIPIFTPRGLGRRQCTNGWKVTPIKRAARALEAKHLTVLLGISIDEVARMKPARERWVTREWPLIDLRLTRLDCMTIIAEAGLPVPPKSACYFCPFQPPSRWQRLATEHPDLWARALELERLIKERRNGKGPAYFTGARLPLRQIAAAEQAGFWTNECEGYCGV